MSPIPDQNTTPANERACGLRVYGARLRREPGVFLTRVPVGLRLDARDAPVGQPDDLTSSLCEHGLRLGKPFGGGCRLGLVERGRTTVRRDNRRLDADNLGHRGAARGVVGSTASGVALALLSVVTVITRERAYDENRHVMCASCVRSSRFCAVLSALESSWQAGGVA